MGYLFMYNLFIAVEAEVVALPCDIGPRHAKALCRPQALAFEFHLMQRVEVAARIVIHDDQIDAQAMRRPIGLRSGQVAHQLQVVGLRDVRH